MLSTITTAKPAQAPMGLPKEAAFEAEDEAGFAQLVDEEIQATPEDVLIEGSAPTTTPPVATPVADQAQTATASAPAAKADAAKAAVSPVVVPPTKRGAMPFLSLPQAPAVAAPTTVATAEELFAALTPNLDAKVGATLEAKGDAAPTDTLKSTVATLAKAPAALSTAAASTTMPTAPVAPKANARAEPQAEPRAMSTDGPALPRSAAPRAGFERQAVSELEPTKTAANSNPTPVASTAADASTPAGVEAPAPRPAFESAPAATADQALATSDGEPIAPIAKEPSAAPSIRSADQGPPVKPTEAPASATPTTSTSSHKRTADIIDQVRVHLEPRRPEITVQLEPKDLGRLVIRLSMKGSELAARISASNPETALRLERDAPLLFRTLGEAGLKVGQIEVRHGGIERDDLGSAPHQGENPFAQAGGGPAAEGAWQEAALQAEREHGDEPKSRESAERAVPTRIVRTGLIDVTV